MTAPVAACSKWRHEYQRTSMIEPGGEPRRFIFYDLKGHRWPRLRLVLAVWGAAGFRRARLFIWSLLVRPELKLRRSLRDMKGSSRRYQKRGQDAGRQERAELAEALRAVRDGAGTARANRAQIRKRSRKTARSGSGYYVEWDRTASPRSRKHAGSLTHIARSGFSLVRLMAG